MLAEKMIFAADRPPDSSLSSLRDFAEEEGVEDEVRRFRAALRRWALDYARRRSDGRSLRETPEADLALWLKDYFRSGPVASAVEGPAPATT